MKAKQKHVFIIFPFIKDINKWSPTDLDYSLQQRSRVFKYFRCFSSRRAPLKVTFLGINVTTKNHLFEEQKVKL